MINYDTFYFFTSIVILILIGIAVYVDMKKKEIPDTVNIIIAFSALLLRAIFSLEFGCMLFIEGVLGGLVLFGAGYFLYRLSQWGGGDVKLLGAIGCFTGLGIWEKIFSFPSSFIFVILLILASGAYGFSVLLYYSIKKTKKTYFIILILTALIFLIMSFVLKNNIVFVFASLIMISSVAIFVYEITQIKDIFFKKIRLLDLREGDWVINKIKIGRKTYYTPKYDGIDQKDIDKIKKVVKRKKKYNLKTTIKEGIALAPAFFIAFIVYIIIIGRIVFF